MKQTLTLSVVMAMAIVLNAVADTLQPSTTLPTAGTPEHVYTITNGNGLSVNATTSPTEDENNFALFAFYAVSGMDDTYYIYNYTASQWVNYSRQASYSNGTSFVKLNSNRISTAYWYISTTSSGTYQLQPYTTSSTTASLYLNYYGGTGSNPLDGSTTLGLWQEDGSTDAGSSWTFSEVDITEYTYTLVCPSEVTVSIDNVSYKDGDTYTSVGQLSPSDVTASAPSGQFVIVQVDNDAMTINITAYDEISQPETETYTIPVLYPQQQEAVGVARSIEEDNVYTLYNNVLAASYIKVGESLYFGGSKAMDLQGGTEPFTVSFGSGTLVPASQMTLTSLQLEQLTGDTTSVGGAEHYDGQALVANYEYTYNDATLKILWKAVLRDGSHYLRTEMELEGDGDVDMYNVVPMIYNVDTEAAGSTPAVVGNTRGAALLSDKIFAGLENPVAYNIVGGSTDEDSNNELPTTQATESLTSSSWTQMASDDVPSRITEVTG